MIYFAIIFLIIIILLLVLKEKNITNPVVLFCSVWLFSLVMASLRLYGMIDFSTKSILIVFLGILFFVLGAFLCVLICKKLKNKFEEKKVDNEKINNVLLIIILTVGLIMSIILSIKVITLLKNGTPYYSIRKMYYSYGEAQSLINNEKIFTLFDWIMSVVITVSTPTVIIGIMKKRISKIAIIEYCMVIIAYVFSTSGRLPIFIIVLETVLYAFLNKDNIELKLKKIIYCVIGALGAIIILMTAIRTSSSQGKKINTFYTYFSLPLPYLSRMIDYVDENEIQTYGAATTYGPYLLIQKGIKVCTGYKLKNAETLANVITKPQTYWVRIFTNTNDYYNAYATLFYYFYLDFRYIGVILFSFIYGAIAELVYLYYKKTKSMKTTIIYLMISFGVIQSFITWQFTSPAIIISLILSNILIRRKKTE